MDVLIACLALASFSVCSATKWEDCGSITSTVKSVTVSGCPDTDDTCTLKHKTNKTTSIEFESKSTASKVKAVVHGVVSGVPIPFPLPKSQGCKFGGLSCPLKCGKTYTYTYNFYLGVYFPPTDVIVRWELQDEDGNDIVCVEIPSQTQ